MKPAILTLMLLILLSGRSYSQIPTNGLIGKYSFNGNADNEIGNYANGEVVGATLTTNKCGVPESAYHFSVATDHIAVSIFDSIPLNEVSFSLWAKADREASSCLLMLAPDDFQDRCVMCAQYMGDPTFIIWDYGDCDWNGRMLLGEIDTSYTWHHYVFMTSESQNLKMIYMDTVCLTSLPYQGSLIDRNRSLYIGAGIDWQFGSIGFRGSIDDLRIYNRAITPDEVKSLFTEVSCNVGINPDTETGTGLNVFPNPAGSMITIDGIHTGRVELFTMQGQLVKIEYPTDSHFKMDISGFPTGVYILKITTANRTTARQVIIQ
jgi:hypothetical protein